MPPQPRALQEHEWPALRGAVNEVFRPGGGDLMAECPLLFAAANRENLRVIVDTGGAGGTQPLGVVTDSSADHERLGQDAPGAAGGPARAVVNGTARGGRLQAHAGFVVRDGWVRERRIRIACVGAVFTRASARGKGLASLVLADALARARAAADLVLVSGDRDLYRRHGLQPVPPLVRFELPAAPPAAAPPQALAPDSQIVARAAEAADLPDMAALYAAEEVHFDRPPADWGLFWGAARLVDAPARFWIVSRAGRTVAYAAVQEPASSPARSRAAGVIGKLEKVGLAGILGGLARPDLQAGSRPRGRMLELAGDREALLQAAPAFADELLVPGYDSGTLEACQRRRWPRTARQFAITAATVTAELPLIPWYGLNYV